VAAAAGAALVAVVAWHLLGDPDAPRRPGVDMVSNIDLSPAGWLACQQTVVQGRVTAAEPGRTLDRQRLTLRVTDWIRPTAGPRTASYDVRNPQVAAFDPPRRTTGSFLARSSRLGERPFEAGERVVLFFGGPPDGLTDRLRGKQVERRAVLIDPYLADAERLAETLDPDSDLCAGGG
jgi:hypothetical protein